MKVANLITYKYVGFLTINIFVMNSNIKYCFSHAYVNIMEHSAIMFSKSKIKIL